MSQETDKNFCYIRPAYDVAAPMEGFCTFQGLSCVVLIHEDRRITVNKLTKDNVPYKVPLFSGQLEANTSEDVQAPHVVARIRNTKLDAYRLALWEMPEDINGPAYYVCRWTELKVRKGEFIRAA